MSTTSPAAAARRVLLVDDQRDFAESLQDVLETRGYAVEIAQTPDEAAAKATSFEPHVALVDVRLGRESGIDVLSALRASRPGLLCVMVTAYADVETAVQALERGAYHYLRKPFPMTDLLATLDRCVEKIRLEEEKAAAEATLRARNRDLAEINERLRLMVESARRLAACDRFDELGPRLLREFARLMAAEGGSLFFRRSDHLERAYVLDADDHVPESLTLPLPDDSVFGRALRERHPIVVRDIAAESGLRRSGWGGYHDGSLLVFPLFLGSEVVGLLSLHSKRWPPFTDQDRELGEIMISLSAELLRTQQVTEVVRSSEERYRLLAENISDVIWITDAELRPSFVSPSVERRTGYSVAEVLERGIKPLLAPTSVARALALLEAGRVDPAGAKPQRTRTADLELVRKDGETIWLEVTVSALPGTNPGAFLGAARDVTARRRAEEQLARVATAVEQAAEDIIVTDKAGVIQYVNPAFERITGYAREEAIGKTPRILKSGAHDETFYRRMWSTLKQGETWAGRFTNRRKDGAQVLEDATISPIRDVSGEIIGYVSAKRDVTRQVSLEARVAHSEKMEAMGRLAGGIAHDFNNVLAAVQGFADLAERADQDPPRLHGYLRGIRDATKRAAGLTRQILTFSRQRPHEMRPVEVKEIVHESLELMRAALPTTIEIRHTLASDAAILADPSQIHQVLVNLCTNAGLAMGELGGTLSVDVSETDLDRAQAAAHPAVSPGRFVRLSVSDSGCGIPADVLPRIFEPFFTTRSAGGTGLGLAVVHGIVEDHGGFITVTSEPGQGATFDVFLPVAVQAPGAEAQAAPDVPRGSARVLFVDDEEVLVSVGKETLEALGYTVTTAGSAAEALDLFKQRPDAFDVVLTDMTMPGMRGDLLAAELLHVRPELPVVLCTGFGERVSESTARALGARELLAKPWTLAELALVLRRVLTTRR